MKIGPAMLRHIRGLSRLRSRTTTVKKSTRSRRGGQAKPAPSRISIRKQILRALRIVAAPGQCVGLWIKNAQDHLAARSLHRTGYFTDFKLLAQQATEYSGKAEGVYITANAVARKALDDETRRLAWNRVSRYGKAPRDEVIFDRRRLLIDIDSKTKPKDDSATEAEKLATVEKGRDVRAWLRQQGWPDPVVIDSGNGVQLVYKIKLPVESTLVKQVLYALADRFDDDAVVIDKAVSSAKTLMRLPGTWNCKGENTPERPHRLARVMFAPKKLKLVSVQSLKMVSADRGKAKPPPPPSPGQVADIDLEQAKKYLDQMEAARRTHSDGSSKAILAARAIVVGFDLPWDSAEAWQLLQHYNARCKPPWDLDDEAEAQDLRRKLREAHDHAEANGHVRGYLRREGRHYKPLEGPMFPLMIPDWDWMAKDTPGLVLDDPPIPYAYGLRILGCWWYERADVLVPDILVKFAHWGAKPPQHWRKHYRGAVVDAKKNFPHLKYPKKCSESCLLHGSKLRHRHYQLVYAKGGLFDEFYDDVGNWGTKGPNWTQHFKDGNVYRGYWPVLIFGTAKPVGLTPGQAKLLAAFTRELTRLAKRPTGKGNAEGNPVYYKPPSDRPDRAEIIEKALVANSAYTHNKLVCPLLDKDQRYVGFNGNFRKHHGRGYRLVTWLDRAGYKARSRDDAQNIISDMAVLAEKFDLVVVGRHHASEKWYTLAEMQEMPHTGYGEKRLNEIMLRCYAPEDFLTLWRYRFAEWLGFSWIPGAACPVPTERTGHGGITSGEDLRVWLEEHGVTQSQLAERAKMRRQTISENLHRASSPAGFWKKINKAIRSWG